MRFFSARLGVVAGALFALGLLVAGPASAAYQQVGTFGGSLTAPLKPGVFPEEDQLGGVSGMAVNVNGAGGVPPGTIYTIRREKPEAGGWKVARFNQDGEFRESWTPLERCGPEIPPVEPKSNPHYPICASRTAEGAIVGFPVETDVTAASVGVDQATGDVYVYCQQRYPSSTCSVVSVYSPDGSKLIAQFGKVAPPEETFAESPEKTHGGSMPGGIAVDDSGNVYIFDRLQVSGSFFSRLMVFRPQAPGDYEHYVYAGQNHDIGAGGSESGPSYREPSNPVVDAAGDVYTASESSIQKFDPSQPATPVCSFSVPGASVTGMTVNPLTGDVFYYRYKDKLIHELKPCDAEGKFVEVEGGSFSVVPQRGNINAFVVNPTLQFAPDRPAGVLYAATRDSNESELESTALGYIFALPVSHSPVVESEDVTSAGSRSARLGGVVDPKGATTRYVFQYLSSALYDANEPSARFAGASEAPIGGGDIAGGQGGVSVSIGLSGLRPGVEYHYRIVATSHCDLEEPAKICEAIGADQVFRTFPTERADLPDGRMFELVSPIEKHGGEVFPANPGIGSCFGEECKPGVVNAQGFPRQSAPNGEAVIYEGSPFAAGQGAVGANEYLAKRTGSGWQTTALSPISAGAGGGAGAFEAFDPALTRGLLHQNAPSLSPQAPSEYPNLYGLSTTDPGTFDPLLSETPPNRPAEQGFLLTYVGASTDLSHVFFEANDALTSETPFAPAAIDGGAAEKNLYEWAGGQLRLVNVAPGDTATTPAAHLEGESLAHVVSGDGSRVFWSSGTGQVFVREDGERTIEIPDHTATFLAAAADGSKVLLSDGRVYGHLENETPSEETDLTHGHNGFVGIVGQSEDLSHIYFIDTAVLDETPNAQGAVAQAGQDNLYAWHEGGTPAFVATLRAGDNEGQAGDWTSAPNLHTAEASPDGRWVAFLSSARLTGYDNLGPCKPEGWLGGYVTGPCGQVFLYDSLTGDLICASCARSNARSLGRSHLTVIADGDRAIAQARYLTDTGRLYFDTQNSLSPFDTNNGVEDVYQYEPAGIGSCTNEEGCVSLISAGHGTVDSNFMTIDPSGKNVFFTTRDELSSSDHDQLVDLYDARENGGIPAESVPQPRECAGDACQGPPSPPPVEPGPGSLAFAGAGNLIAPAPAAVTTPARPKAKTLTHAQRLAKALRTCRTKHGKRRSSCEKAARKRYATTAKHANNNKRTGGK